MLADYFEKDEKDFPRELMKRKARAVRDAIVAIENATDLPKLVRMPAK